jgi:hypothetical protein
VTYEDWAREHAVTDLPATVAAALAEWVESLPWGPSRLDWSNVSHVMLHVPSHPADEILRVVAPVLGDSAQVAVLAGADHAIVGDSTGLLANLDELTYYIGSFTLFLFPVVGSEVVLNRLMELQAPDRLRFPLSGRLAGEDRRVTLPAR